MQTPEVVKLVNQGPFTIVLPHLGQRFDIPPGAYKLVPWAAVVSMYGDPRAQNIGQHKGREDLYRRTRAFHNFYEGFDTEEVWEQEKRPRIAVYDINTDERIYMLIEDREGRHADQLTQAPEEVGMSDTALLQRQVNLLQEQLAQLTSLMAAQQATTPGVSTVLPDSLPDPHDLVIPTTDPSTAVTEDKPRSVTTRK